MITEKQMLEHMERTLLKAKQATSPEQMRDEVAGIKAMCELFLNASPKQGHVIQPTSQLVSHSKSSVHLVESKLQDEDANGDSIFDF